MPQEEEEAYIWAAILISLIVHTFVALLKKIIIPGPFFRDTNLSGLGPGYILDFHIYFISHFYLIQELSVFRANIVQKGNTNQKKVGKIARGN